MSLTDWQNNMSIQTKSGRNDFFMRFAFREACTDKGQGGINEYFKRRAPKAWCWRPWYV